MEEGLWGPSGAPAGPDAPGPSRIGGSAPPVRVAEVETEGNKLGEQGGIDLDQTLPGLNPEDVAAVIISDDDDTDFPIDMPQAVSTPKVPYICHRLRNEQRDTGCGATSHLVGCGN